MWEKCHMISEKGDFARIAAPVLLLRIAESKLTGILYLKQEDTLKALHFDGGRLVWAISNSVEDKLERILVEGRLVDELKLNRIRRQQSGAALGKTLVEKGLLSVEQLVECTRLQFKRILDDVLNWNRGGFQVIESPPPENLFKMDLDLVSMVFNFVLEHVTPDQVQQRIPDLSVHPESRADDSRVAAFNLSQKKREFLTLFNGRQSVANILSHYADSHREALLKVVYFFLLADLIRLPGESDPMEKGDDAEPDKVSVESSLPDSLPGIDKLEPLPIRENKDLPPLKFPEDEEPELPADNEAPEALVNLDVDSAEPGPEFYSFTDEQPEAESSEINLPETEDLLDPVMDSPPEARAYSFADSDPEEEIDISPGEPSGDLDVDAMLRGEKSSRQGRQVNMLLILVVAILVTGGAIFLLLMSGGDEMPSASTPGPAEKTLTQKADTVGKSAPSEVIQVKEKASLQTAATGGEKKKEIAKTPGRTAAKPDRSVTPPPTAAGPDPMELLKRGRYTEAANRWRSRLSGNMAGYSILLELDCQTVSVGAAFNRIHNPESFFLLPRSRGDRTCYLVMWGRFESREEAATALKTLPAYFLNQDPPAKVVALSNYR